MTLFVPCLLGEIHGPDAWKIADMLVDIGPDDSFPITRAFFTCRHFDIWNRVCRNYPDRPNMCRNYPYSQKCNYEDCTLSPPGEAPWGFLYSR